MPLILDNSPKYGRLRFASVGVGSALFAALGPSGPVRADDRAPETVSVRALIHIESEDAPESFELGITRIKNGCF